VAQLKQEAGLDDRPCTWHLSSSRAVVLDWSCMAVPFGLDRPLLPPCFPCCHVQHDCMFGSWTGSLFPAQW
jgi:hypothetical protein